MIPPAAVVAGLFVVIVAAVLLLRHRDRILAWHASRIRPGTVVWAMVPFSDGRGQKDRPILVLGSQGRSLVALKLTTQSKEHRRDCLRIGDSTWDHRRRQSWLDCGQVLHVDVLRVRGTGRRGHVTARELATARSLVAAHARPAPPSPYSRRS